MIKLKPFQLEASAQIAERFETFTSDQERPRKKGYGALPFFQVVSAITGSGKTPILADAVQQMRTALPIEPVVLWISKGRVVVDQTLANFADGGKYHHLVPDFDALPLRDCIPTRVAEADKALLLLGTVATFNSNEKDNRRIFEVDPDVGGESLWDTLISRRTAEGTKRGLLVVYDEAHNLTDQQASLLLELRPDAIVMASATPKLPTVFKDISELLTHNQYGEAFQQTGIRSRDVVEAQLVKREVRLDGYLTAPEEAISAMVQAYHATSKLAADIGAAVSPKCIYVCRTNLPGDEQKDFVSRQAPPIRIWRHLVDICNIDPAAIAVYCDLKVSATHPLDGRFRLFKNGDNDYASFIAGGFRHVIFNLSLQEGWDDPECYLAYVDKDMASELQVEQIVGRVLRQPNAEYYPDDDLNACSFFIHIDSDSVFKDTIERVKKKLSQDIPEIEIATSRGGAGSRLAEEPRMELSLPTIMLDMSESAAEVDKFIELVSDYAGSTDAIGEGLVATVEQAVGETATPTKLDWIPTGKGMPVSVRWLLGRYIEKQYSDAVAVCDMGDARFSVPVHLGSKADRQLRKLADQIVAKFLEHASCAVLAGKATPVGRVVYNPGDYTAFRNSVHERYSGLNADESECALALDELGWPWYRNPSMSGFALPLLRAGRSRRFFPDFIVWTDKEIWLIDPKADHLIADAAGRKLVELDVPHGETPVRVCLTARGQWDANFNKLTNSGISGWRRKVGGLPLLEHYGSFTDLLTSVIGVAANRKSAMEDVSPRTSG